MEVLDQQAVRRWARLSADALGRAGAAIDALNVFPVADGDTGTNLHLTMLSATEAVEALPDDVDTSVLWQTLAYGALIGARGNSGVILSQALRGMAEVLKSSEGSAADLAAALVHAASLARGAVSRPVEGTILSVLTAAAEAARAAYETEEPQREIGHTPITPAGARQENAAPTGDLPPEDGPVPRAALAEVRGAGAGSAESKRASGGVPATGGQAPGDVAAETGEVSAAMGRVVGDGSAGPGEGQGRAGRMLEVVARAAAEEGRAALRRTPGQLEVLARSGVVDAGGAGLVIVLEALAEVVAGGDGQRCEVPAPTARVAPMTES